MSLRKSSNYYLINLKGYRWERLLKELLSNQDSLPTLLNIADQLLSWINGFKLPCKIFRTIFSYKDIIPTYPPKRYNCSTAFQLISLPFFVSLSFEKAGNKITTWFYCKNHILDIIRVFLKKESAMGAALRHLYLKWPPKS